MKPRKPADPITLKKILKPKTQNQTDYIRAIAENEITFAIGPAGCGKSHIAVALAIQYLIEEKVKRIIITRPIVETGEHLGALPGDIAEKTGPYLAPIYEELKHFISYTDIVTLQNQTDGGIEIAPLAFMRGRNFHDSFIILDEAQNCTYEQLRMFLTRIVRNSKMVITGDPDQSDLFPKDTLQNVVNKLNNIQGIAIAHLDSSDIVRNSLISHILRALA